MNIEAFLDQAREYDTAGDLRDGFLKVLNLLGTTHPSPWSASPSSTSGAQRRVRGASIGGDYPRREDDSNARISEEVKAAADSYRESWSESQDPFIGVLRDVAEGAVHAGERIFNRFSRRDGS